MQVSTLADMITLRLCDLFLSAAAFTGHRVIQSDTEHISGPESVMPTGSEPRAVPRPLGVPAG